MTVTYRAFVEAKMYNAYDFSGDTEAEARAKADSQLGASKIERWEVVPPPPVSEPEPPQPDQPLDPANSGTDK